MAEFVGGFIDPEVIAQIDRRNYIYSKSPKTPEDILFVNSRNAWVRVVSSVDVALNNQPYTSDYARQFVLSNLSNIDQKNNPVNLSGINFNSSDKTSAYTFNTATGVRPKPGITSFSVVHKNRFGTIREANIAFSVWSSEDLDIIERLYFRPGFSCIVEWGHTIRVNNQGQVETDTSVFNSDLATYFNNGSFENLYDKLKQKKRLSNFNYDSFVGFIKNFSWSFRSDGGYDCSISVISTGEVLESLRVDKKYNISKEEDKSAEAFTVTNIYTKFITDLRKISGDQGGPGLLPFIRKKDATATTPASFSQEIESILGSLTFPKAGIGNNEVVGIKKKIGNVGKLNSFVCYFPLKYLLALTNGDFIPKNEYCEPLGGFDLDSEEQYFSFPNHYSTDPLICWLPKPLKFEKVPVTSNTTGTLEVDIPFTQLSSTSDRILDILITDKLVEETVKKLGTEVTVSQFINSILQEINKALGGMNEFIIQEVEDSNLVKIVDRAIIPSKQTQINGRKIQQAVIPISGVKNTVRSLNISSKISKDLVTTVAIAAQSSVDINTPHDILPTVEWNKGVVDRFSKERKQENCRNITEQAKTEEAGNWSKIVNFLKSALTPLGEWFSDTVKQLDIFTNKDKPTFESKAKQAYAAFFKFDNTDRNDKRKQIVDGEYDASSFELLKTQSNTYFKSVYVGESLPKVATTGDEANELVGEDVIAKGIIPVELSFTIDGISGFKIGEAFKVSPHILPAKYDEVGFIILGLDHVIENNRWYTNVRSQIYVLKGKNIENNYSVLTSDDIEGLGNVGQASVDLEDVEGTNNSGTLISQAEVPSRIKLSPTASEEQNLQYRALVSNMGLSISTFEGYSKPDTVSRRNNNPGNLRSWRGFPVVDGFAKFPTPDVGWEKLYTQIDLNIKRNLSFLQFFAGVQNGYPGYAPAADNNQPSKYAQFVLDRLPNTTNINEKILDYFNRNTVIVK